MLRSIRRALPASAALVLALGLAAPTHALAQEVEKDVVPDPTDLGAELTLSASGSVLHVARNGAAELDGASVALTTAERDAVGSAIKAFDGRYCLAKPYGDVTSKDAHPYTLDLTVQGSGKTVRLGRDVTRADSIAAGQPDDDLVRVLGKIRERVAQVPDVTVETTTRDGKAARPQVTHLRPDGTIEVDGKAIGKASPDEVKAILRAFHGVDRTYGLTTQPKGAFEEIEVPSASAFDVLGIPQLETKVKVAVNGNSFSSTSERDLTAKGPPHMVPGELPSSMLMDAIASELSSTRDRIAAEAAGNAGIAGIAGNPGKTVNPRAASKSVGIGPSVETATKDE